MDEPNRGKFRVVCLGGSAGGLEAYKAILRRVPADSGMAFVVASHRRSGGTNLLVEILAGVTVMPVREVGEGMILEPNRVYVMPPAKEMTLSKNVFALLPLRKSHGFPITLDLFLASLAEACGKYAIAVILSGLDGDGSGALEAVKAAGGITFAQSDAEVTDMPRHAIATGYVDFILSPREIADKLLELSA